jgi:hypothetical protein
MPLVQDPAAEMPPSQLTLMRHGLFIFASFGGAALMGVFLGAALGEYLKSHPDTRLPWLGVKVTLGSGALAVSTLIATLKETLQVLGTLPGHLESPASRPAFLDMLKLFFTFFALIVATKVVQIEKESLEVNVSSQPFEFIATAPVAAPEPVITFPLLFADNGSKKDGEWERGVTPESARISAILAAVDPCVDRSMETPAPTVTLEVVGFASTREFAKQVADASERLNVELANQRTVSTFEALRRAVDEGPLKGLVRVDRAPNWQNYLDMVSARPVLDRMKDVEREQLENWTRRADVKVMRAGRCTRMHILQNVGVVRADRMKPTPTT